MQTKFHFRQLPKCKLTRRYQHYTISFSFPPSTTTFNSFWPSAILSLFALLFPSIFSLQPFPQSTAANVANELTTKKPALIVENHPTPIFSTAGNTVALPNAANKYLSKSAL